MKGYTTILLSLFFTSAVIMGCSEPEKSASRWWKGNLHTHSLWSDGDDYPEMIVDWYKKQGYHFLALSDHNILPDHERWTTFLASGERKAPFLEYQHRFGEDWVEAAQGGDTLKVRLKKLSEYRGLFEEPGAFLLISSEEITDRFGRLPIHINATNILDLIQPQGGGSVLEVMQRNVDAVLAQRKATGRPMFPHINHPNFGWGITAEDLVELQGERFFEVYNGHPAVHNEGDATRPGTERMWDYILAERLRQGRDLLYGLAVDDSHNYHTESYELSNPGRGWVMVRSETLTADALVLAMEAGAFYGTTGVVLQRVEADEKWYRVEVEPEDQITYRIQFIGTRSEAVPAEGQAFSLDDEGVGVVLQESEGTTAQYEMQGDELYVRARVISSKPKVNGYQPGEYEQAWLQPVRVRE